MVDRVILASTGKKKYSGKIGSIVKLEFINSFHNGTHFAEKEQQWEAELHSGGCYQYSDWQYLCRILFFKLAERRYSVSVLVQTVM